MTKDNLEIKPVMTLEEAYGSVKPINRPENFKQLRNTAIEEHVEFDEVTSVKRIEP